MALALPLVLQLGLGDVADAVVVGTDQTIEASSQRGVKVAGQEVQKITNPRVRVLFDVTPDLVGVTTSDYAAGANPDDPSCGANHDPLGAGTVNMTIVADLQAGATGTREILVEYTETHSDGTVHTHPAHQSTEPIGPVGPAGDVKRVPVCVYR